MEKLDYFTLINEAKKITENSKNYPSTKIAILGDCATQHIAQALKSWLFRQGVYSQVYEAEYDVINQEIIDINSGLYAFQPDYVIVFTAIQQLRNRYNSQLKELRVGYMEEFADVVVQWWDRLTDKLSCRVIHALPALPLERPFGNYTQKVDDSFASLTARCERSIIEGGKI